MRHRRGPAGRIRNRQDELPGQAALVCRRRGGAVAPRVDVRSVRRGRAAARATAGSNPGPGCSGRLTLPAGQVQPMRARQERGQTAMLLQHRRQGARGRYGRTTAPCRRRSRRPRRGPTAPPGRCLPRGRWWRGRRRRRRGRRRRGAPHRGGCAGSRCSRRRPRSRSGTRPRLASFACSACQCGRIASPLALSLAAMPPTPTLRWPPALGTYQL